MTLLSQLQDQALDDDVPVTSILRRCLVLAQRLGYAPLGEWARHELNGYSSDDALPDYRSTTAAAYGDFLGLGHAQRKNVQIPPAALPQDHRRFAESVRLTSGIAHYQAISEKGRAGDLLVSWPGDLVLAHQSDILEGWILTHAWQPLMPGVIPQLLDAVRNRILLFAMEIEKENPQAGEADPEEEPVPVERVANVFNTYVMGDRPNVAVSSSETFQLQGIQPGDLAALSAALESLGLHEEDIDELREAIALDGTVDAPGDAVQGWFGRLSSKAASGALSVSTSVVGGAVWGLIEAYFGIAP